MAARESTLRERRWRFWLALAVIAISVVGLVGLAVVVVRQDETQALTVFNVLVPLIATWVGTILAFYFGQDAFVAANEQVRETLSATSAQEPTEPVSSIMRELAATLHKRIEEGSDTTQIAVGDLKQLMVDADRNRLPIIDIDGSPKYMIHLSSFDNYLNMNGHDGTESLQQFIDDSADQGKRYDNENGFVAVAATSSLPDAKKALEAIASVKDAFITKNGTANEPVLGWLSDVRLYEHLDA